MYYKTAFFLIHMRRIHLSATLCWLSNIRVSLHYLLSTEIIMHNSTILIKTSDLDHNPELQLWKMFRRIYMNQIWKFNTAVV